MPPNDDDLADRFRAALEQQEAVTTSPRTALSVDVDAAREELFRRLSAFAAMVQQIDARTDGDDLVLGYANQGVDRRVRFAPSAAGVVVTYEGWPVAETHAAWPEPALDGRWVLDFHRLGRKEEMPLFERGLEELLVHGLGMPRPAASNRPISPRTAAALTARAPATAAKADLAPRADGRSVDRPAPTAPKTGSKTASKSDGSAGDEPPKRPKRDL